MSDINNNDQPIDFNPVRLSDGSAFIDLAVNSTTTGLKVHVVGSVDVNGKLLGADGTTQATVSTNAGSNELATHDKDMLTGQGAELTGNAYPAGAAGIRGGLSAIWQRLADGTTIVKGAKVVVAALAVLTDTASAHLRVDKFGRLWVRGISTAVDPYQVPIHRRGTITTNSTTFTPVTTASTPAANFGANDIDYTVPAGTVFYLMSIGCDVLDDFGTSGVIFALSWGGVRRYSRSTISRSGAAPHLVFIPPLPIPAGSIITVDAHMTGGTGSAQVIFQGIQESLT